MRLHDYPVLTDENIHPDVVAWLRAHRCDVLDVRDVNLIGSGDRAIMQVAQSQGRIILTHDSDFGALSIARLEPIVGLVFLRPGHLDPAFTIRTLETVFALDLDPTPPFLIVAKRTGDEVTIRLRNL